MPISTVYEGARHEDLRDIMSVVIPGAGLHPFLSMHLDQGIAVTDTTHKWGDKVLKGHRGVLNEALDDSETGIDVVSSATLKVFNSTTNSKCWIMIDSEAMEVTAGAGTTTLTVTRGVGGTTAAAHSTGANIEVIRHFVEGADQDINDVELGAKKYNLVQRYRYGLDMSAESQAVKSLGGDLKLAQQVEEKMMQCLDDLERDALTSNLRYADGTEKQRIMGGLRYYATKNANAQTLNDTFIQTAINTLLDAGASPSQLCMIVPSNLYPKIATIKENMVKSGGTGDKEKSIVKDFDTYVYAEAPVKILRNFRMLPSQVCFYDKSKIKIAPLQGEALHVEDLAKTGDGEKKMLAGSYTMEVMNGAETALWYSSVS